jgi:predicted glycosyltransferase
MGGYNTFCEILSFDKRALIVPRTRRAWSSISAPRAPPNSGWCAC